MHWAEVVPVAVCCTCEMPLYAATSVTTLTFWGGTYYIVGHLEALVPAEPFAALASEPAEFAVAALVARLAETLPGVVNGQATLAFEMCRGGQLGTHIYMGLALME